jgi:hypothetical protein
MKSSSGVAVHLKCIGLHWARLLILPLKPFTLTPPSAATLHQEALVKVKKRIFHQTEKRKKKEKKRKKKEKEKNAEMHCIGRKSVRNESGPFLPSNIAMYFLFCFRHAALLCTVSP